MNPTKLAGGFTKNRKNLCLTHVPNYKGFQRSSMADVLPQRQNFRQIKNS
jgi:hypothetical protein